MTLLTLKNVTKKFVASCIQTTSLNGINFTMDKGDFIAVSGESGSGKTTLLNVIGMLDDFDSGEYFFGNTHVNKLSNTKAALFRKQKIGYIFQNFNLLNELTVYDNIAMPLKFQGVRVKERKERVLHIAETLGIAHRINHSPWQLSGGQQQRVACARALVSGSELILADEPTGNLDQESSKSVLELLQEINLNGTSIVLVTHSNEHAQYAKQKKVMCDGQLVKE